MIKVVARANGILETVDAPDMEAELQARIVSDRVALRRMLDGGERFHVDPMATPIDDDGTDVWHTEAPTVAGVYMTRLLEPGGRTGPRWFGGTFYHALGGNGNDPRKCMCYGNNRDIEWSHLISADTTPIADWRPGDQVPEGERVGLWFCRTDTGKSWSGAQRADFWEFRKSCTYRPAAPGVREGEAYDEARYAKGAA